MNDYHTSYFLCIYLSSVKSPGHVPGMHLATRNFAGQGGANITDL